MAYVDVCVDSMRGCCADRHACKAAHGFDELCNLRCWVHFWGNPRASEADVRALVPQLSSDPKFRVVLLSDGMLVRFSSSTDAEQVVQRYGGPPYNARKVSLDTRVLPRGGDPGGGSGEGGGAGEVPRPFISYTPPEKGRAAAAEKPRVPGELPSGSTSAPLVLMFRPVVAKPTPVPAAVVPEPVQSASAEHGSAPSRTNGGSPGSRRVYTYSKLCAIRAAVADRAPPPDLLLKEAYVGHSRSGGASTSRDSKSDQFRSGGSGGPSKGLSSSLAGSRLGGFREGFGQSTAHAPSSASGSSGGGGPLRGGPSSSSSADAAPSLGGPRGSQL
eukprot:RCo036003